jgi:hypothetical protein
VRLRARHRSESGQTTALVSAMLFTLAMFVALVVDVGQMVNRRVALQLVADAGAWTGATVQAVQLNHYAFWSRLVQNAYKNASGISLGFRASECWSGVSAVGLFLYANSGMGRAILNFRNKAYDEAENHSLYNIDDLFPGERNNFSFSTNALTDGGVIAPLSGNIIPIPLRRGDRLYTGDHAWSREMFSQLLIEFSVRITGRLPWAVSSAGSGNENWQCGTLLPPTSFRIYMPGPPGWKLQRLGPWPYLFVWKVTEQRPTRALFFDRFFGPNTVPAMTAVGVAKAVGGDVQRGRSRYRAKMIPVSRYSVTQGLIRDSLARPGRLLPNPIRRIVH